MTRDTLSWIDAELAALEARHLRRRLVMRDDSQRSEIAIDGQRFFNFSANDYLGLAGDARLAEAAMQAATRDGWGAGASPLVTGRSQAHAELERRLAEFEGTEAA